jgi:hypothetical protein
MPVKEAAVVSLIHLLRFGIRGAVKRREICNRLIVDFARGKSCWNRMLFGNLCVTTMKVFSRKFFKETFMDAVLEMAQVRTFED